MRDLNLVQAGLGAVALMIGLAILVAAIRSGSVGESPRATAMLIGGMMLATFGLLMAAFAIGFAASSPANLATEVRP